MLRLLAATVLTTATASAVPVWKAPPNPMALARTAGLVPEVNEHLTYHVHSHLDVFVNGTLIGRGEVVTVGDKFGVRMTELVAPEKRAAK